MGPGKIRYELKQKQVSDYNIKKALKEIDEEQYVKVLLELATEKYAALNDEQGMLRKKKTIDYLLQKGFEMDLINQAVRQVTGN